MKLLAALLLIVAQASGGVGHLPPSLRARLDHQISHQTSAAMTTAAVPAYLPRALPVPIGKQPLAVDANSVIAVDATTMQVLYAKDADTKRPLASITKLVTALVILSGHAPTESVTIPTLPQYTADDAILGIAAGQIFTVHDLVQAMLIVSADDSADALAIWDSGSQAAFATKMNNFLLTWQIGDSHFVGPSGLIDSDNYATAASLARLGRLALANNLVQRTVSLPSANISDAVGHSYNLKSTNTLLANPSFHGIKTGYTAAAGECFVGLATISGHDVITVVLGAHDRFGATTGLVNWIGSNWQWL